MSAPGLFNVSHACRNGLVHLNNQKRRADTEVTRLPPTRGKDHRCERHHDDDAPYKGCKIRIDVFNAYLCKNRDESGENCG
jgi:hypothetical protein